MPSDAWSLRVVGRLDMDPAYVRRINQTLAVRGLAHRVKLVGRREGPALAVELERAHLLCMPYAYEGFGMATLESQAFGLPVIGAREGATGELITHGLNGFLIRRGDHAAVCRVLAALDRDRPKLGQLGLAAHRRFERHPTWSGAMARLADFLETLALSRRTRTSKVPAALKTVSS